MSLSHKICLEMTRFWTLKKHQDVNLHIESFMVSLFFGKKQQ